MRRGHNYGPLVFRRLEDSGTELIVPHGQAFEIRFSRGDTPIQLFAETFPRPLPPQPDPVASSALDPPVAPGNPASVPVALESGAYWLSVRSRWPEGEVTEWFPLRVL